MLGKKNILFQNLINRILLRDVISLAKLLNKHLEVNAWASRERKGAIKEKLTCSSKKNEKKMVPFQGQSKREAVRAEDIKGGGGQRR